MSDHHQPRAPRGIRRHYDTTETTCVRLISPTDSADILGRPHTGTAVKKTRLDGLKDDTHTRDGSWKYIAQKISKPSASRNGLAWERWEDDYLLRAADLDDLLSKALRIRRTYRACETRRRDLLRRLDAERNAA